MVKDREVPANKIPWPSPLYSWYVVGVLMLAYTNAYIDRQILSLLIEPIRQDLQLTDTQISLLAGLAFTIFYTLMGIPIARLADQKNRRNLIAAGIVCWSLMTAACGLAKTYWHLFLARVGVGVGEATLSPTAMSMIADYFPLSKLARAFSVYSMGVYFGAGLALIIGGVVINLVTQAGSVSLPFVGEVLPWQMTFFFVGLLGLPIVLLVLTIREPVRRGNARAGSAEALSASSVAALKALIRRNQSTVIYHFATFAFIGLGIIGYMVWMPTFFIRSFGWNATQIGLVYGCIMFFGGTAGVYCGGYLADWLQKRGHDDAIMRATFYSGIMIIPCAVLTPLMPTPWLAVAGLAVTTFLMALPQGLPGAALQLIAPNALRAQMTAVYFLVNSLVASGLGPTVYALVTDYVFKDPARLGYSMALVSAVVMPLGTVFAWLALRPYRASVLAVQAIAKSQVAE